MSNGLWNARINRAAKLISLYPFAAEGLGFYIRVAEFQRGLYAEIEKSLANLPRSPALPSLSYDLDLFLLREFSDFLDVIEDAAPAPLAQAATALGQDGSDPQRQVLSSFWQYRFDSPADGQYGDGDDTALHSRRLLAWTFLQPYAEYLTQRRPQPNVDGTPLRCPICRAKPIVGVLREEGDGAKKSLVCMLCAYEWNFRRVYCPACGEEREPQLGFYSAPEIPHLRVDVCDTCHTYLKTVDLTKTGLAVPVVDELATIPLDLWAREHGYYKLQTNLLGA
jgi:FdhE protein